MEAQSNASAAEVKQPVVFQCNKCKEIVGDSLAWVQADESVGTITLSAMRGVQIREESLQTSKAGKDIGCTFVPVHCESCKVVIGKMYKTTSRAFDAIRDYFTIETKTLRGYELGKYDSEAPASIDGAGAASASVDTAALQEKLWRIEQVILLFHERFERVESFLGIAEKKDHNDDRDDSQRKKSQKTNSAGASASK